MLDKMFLYSSLNALSLNTRYSTDLDDKVN